MSKDGRRQGHQPVGGHPEAAQRDEAGQRPVLEPLHEVGLEAEALEGGEVGEGGGGQRGQLVVAQVEAGTRGGGINPLHTVQFLKMSVKIFSFFH